MLSAVQVALVDYLEQVAHKWRNFCWPSFHIATDATVNSETTAVLTSLFSGQYICVYTASDNP